MFRICFQCFLLFGMSFFLTLTICWSHRLHLFFLVFFLISGPGDFPHQEKPKSSKLWAFVSPFPVCRFFSLFFVMSLHHLLFAVSMFVTCRFLLHLSPRFFFALVSVLFILGFSFYSICSFVVVLFIFLSKGIFRNF